MVKVIETILVLSAMVFVLFGREVGMVPRVAGTIAGVLSMIAMLAAGAPSDIAVAGGMVIASLLAEIFDYLLERHC